MKYSKKKLDDDIDHNDYSDNDDASPDHLPALGPQLLTLGPGLPAVAQTGLTALLPGEN